MVTTLLYKGMGLDPPFYLLQVVCRLPRAAAVTLLRAHRGAVDREALALRAERVPVRAPVEMATRVASGPFYMKRSLLPPMLPASLRY